MFVEVGDGDMGAHYTIVFPLYVFEIFHEKCFLKMFGYSERKQD